jgi:hypothetical protein
MNIYSTILLIWLAWADRCCIPVCRALKETFRTELVSHMYLLLICTYLLLICLFLTLTYTARCCTRTLPSRMMIMTRAALYTRAGVKLTHPNWLLTHSLVITFCWNSVSDGKAGTQCSLLWSFTNKAWVDWLPVYHHYHNPWAYCYRSA